MKRKLYMARYNRARYEWTNLWFTHVKIDDCDRDADGNIPQLAASARSVRRIQRLLRDLPRTGADEFHWHLELGRFYHITGRKGHIIYFKRNNELEYCE